MLSADRDNVTHLHLITSKNVHTVGTNLATHAQCKLSKKNVEPTLFLAAGSQVALSNVLHILLEGKCVREDVSVGGSLSSCAI